MTSLNDNKNLEVRLEKEIREWMETKECREAADPGLALLRKLAADVQCLPVEKAIRGE